MPSKALVSIYKSGWVNLPTPSDYKGTSTTLVNSARNAKGQVVGTIVASDIAKIELKWNYLTTSQYATIAQLFEPKYGGNFFAKVKFFDMVKGDWDDATPFRVFYVGDRKVEVAHIVLDSTTGSPIGYKDVSLNLIDTGKREAL